MASPHAVGVAALIVSEKGQRDCAPRRPDAGPGQGREGPAPYGDRHAVPGRRSRSTTRTRTWTRPFDATCEGTPAFNGFYGDGIVNALAASKSGGNRR